MFQKKAVLKNFAYLQENIDVRDSLLPATLLKRDFNTGVFLFKNTYFEEHLRTVASAFYRCKLSNYFQSIDDSANLFLFLKNKCNNK